MKASSTYHIRIRRSTGLGRFDFLELWSFRGLLAALAMRDLKLRYRQTALGVGWVLIQPFLACGIMAFVFGTVAGITRPGKSSAFIFVLGGFIGWSLFSTIFLRVTQCLVQHAGLISKIFFPRVILPGVAVVSALLDTAVVLALFFLLVLPSGGTIGFQVLLLPVWLLVILVLAFGLGLISAALSVRFRDVQHIIPVLLQIAFYATPIAYSASAVPERWRGLFMLNPLAPLFEALRFSLLNEGRPSLGGIVYSLLAAASAFLVGSLFFKQAEREFADVI
jgi:lipopolysaccharide transport system permease protein